MTGDRINLRLEEKEQALELLQPPSKKKTIEDIGISKTCVLGPHAELWEPQGKQNLGPPISNNCSL
jgi:hypothetical protein